MTECPASIEEPGLFYYQCELEYGHEGQHVVHWDEEVSPPRPLVEPSPGYVFFLRALYGPPLSATKPGESTRRCATYPAAAGAAGCSHG